MTESQHDQDPSQSKEVVKERRANPRRYYHYSSVLRFVVPPSLKSQRAILRDVSITGLRLHIDMPLEPGTALVVELCGLLGVTHPRAATVVRSEAHEGGGWLIGCKFTLPLSSFDRVRTLQFCAEDDYGAEE